MNDVTDRLELFRRMKASVRGSEKYLLVGVDVAKNNHHAFFWKTNGVRLDIRSFVDLTLSALPSAPDPISPSAN